MVVANPRNALYGALPNQVTLANGDVFSLSKRDGIEKDARPTFPYIEIEPVDNTPVSKVLTGRPEEHNDNEQTDVLTFADGTLIYRVTEPDIAEVSSVTAVSGTFTEGIDFEVIETLDSGLPNALEFDPDESTPDDGEDFEVQYTHRLVAPIRRRFEKGSFLVFVHGRQFLQGEGTGVTGETASKNYSKSDLVIEVAEAIEEQLILLLGSTIGPDNQMTLQAARNFSDWTVEEGDSSTNGMLEVFIKRTRDVKEPKVRLIGSIETEFDVTT